MRPLTKRQKLAVLGIWLALAGLVRAEERIETGVKLACLAAASHDLAVLDDFPAAAQPAWELKTGVEVKLDFGTRLPGLEGDFLRIEGIKKAPNAREKGRSWFSLSRPVEAKPEWSQAEGVRVVLGLRRPGKWWLGVGVTCNGVHYSGTLLPYEYTESAVVDRVVKFSQMVKDGKQPDPAKITAISLGGAVEENVLYVDKLALTASPQRTGWLTFSTTKPELSLFERGAAVGLRFGREGTPPAEAVGVRYALTDYWEKPAGGGEFKLAADQTEYKVELAGLASGYYEVRAWWTDANGRDLETDSCLKSPGSVLPGQGTFAVLANTAAESTELFKKYGQSAFLGLHGDRFGLADLCGLSWRNEYWKWPWIEKNQPDRSGGLAEWARKQIADGPKNPDGSKIAEPAGGAPGAWPAYRSHISSLRANLGEEAPEWARRSDYRTSPPPAYKEWSYLLDMFRDYIEVEKVRYPHLQPRLYDVAWEINLNLGLGSFQKPSYSYDDVVELYRRCRPVLKKTDPAGFMIGPCYSSLLEGSAIESHEELFKRGLLEYLDAIDCHAYHTPPPERIGIPEKTRRFNRLVAQYKNGLVLPIYCTELGFRSRYGTISRHREQAQWLARVATIFKGEGWRAFLPFYILDGDDVEGSYGICFNPYTKPTPWSPKALFPKPAVPALAVWAHRLEGTTPVRHLRFFGEDVWGYVFARDNQPVLVLWTVERLAPLSLPVGEGREVELVDFMGGVRRIKAEAGAVRLELGPAPQYVFGAAAEIYLSSLAQEREADVFALHAGQTREVELPLPAGAKLAAVAAGGGILAEATGDNRARLKAPAEAECGPRALRIEYTDKDGRKQVAAAWAVLRPSIQPGDFGLVVEGGRPYMKLDLANVGALELPVRVELNADGVRTEEPNVVIAPDQPWSKLLPLPFEGLPDPQRRLQVELTVAARGEPALTLKREVNFLGAARLGGNDAGALPCQAVIAGTGSSGQLDKAELSFAWDAENLYLTVESHDDVFRQEKTDANIWQQDSLQLAFDSHPEQTEVYNPLASIFTKRICELGAALTPRGPLVWRYHSFDKNRLDEGDISAACPAKIERDEAKKLTRYELTFPWAQLGMEKEWVKPGKVLGFSLLVNDSDGHDRPRQGLEFFSGIMRDKTHEQYGRLTLQ